MRLLVVGLLLVSSAGADPQAVAPPLVTVPVVVTLAGFQPPAGTVTKPKLEIDLDAALSIDVDPSRRRGATREAGRSIEELGGPIRADQERILEELVASTADPELDKKADYLFRLGALQANRHRAFRASGDHRQAKAYLVKATLTYQKLTDNSAFRNYPKRDIALFYFGYTLHSGRYMKDARLRLDRLLKDYPNSKYVPEAHLVFADYFFDIDQLADAEARYKVVLKFPKSNVYWYAVYKLAWIQLGRQRYQEALEQFFQAAQGTKSGPLHRASKIGFVHAYVQIGKADKAYAAFQRGDQRLAPALASMLADLYAEQGKHDQAAVIYRDLVKQLPAHSDACAWQLGLARATLATLATGRAKSVDVCPNDVGALADWVRRNGGSVP